MFPQLAREAVRDDTDFLVNLTNDGWFGESAEQWQHMAGAVFRAVENGVPLVRCCNNGVTCWIDAHGRVREIFRDNSGSVYGTGALTIDLPLQKHAPTFYNRHGDWFGWGCVGIAMIVLALKRPVIILDGNLRGMNIRRYRPGDEERLWQLYHDTTHIINGKDYTREQCERWAPTVVDMSKWKERTDAKNPFVAEGVKKRKDTGLRRTGTGRTY